MDVNGIDNLRQQKDAMTASLKENMDFLNRKLDIDKNFDLVYRDAENAAALYGYQTGRTSGKCP